MSALGIKNLPKQHTMKEVARRLQQLCGVQSIRYEGQHGHIFYTNDIAAIIAQVRLSKI
jgi:hypothetical protein